MAINQNNGGRQDARLDNLEKAVDELKRTVKSLWVALNDQRNDLTAVKGKTSTLIVALIFVSTFASNLLARWLF